MNPDLGSKALAAHPGWRALLWALITLAPAPLLAVDRLDDNAAVLTQFAQTAGGPEPALVRNEDGTTKIEWHGSITVDGYSRSASGDATLTPYSSGEFHRADVQSDLRGTSPAGDVSWMQFALTHSSDPSLIAQGDLQVNTFSIGRAGQGYRVALGDVAVEHSSLGANMPLRGLLAQRYFGRTLVSASAGVVSESWEALADQGRRRMFLKNAYALKAQTPLGQNLQAYFTVQGYSEDGDSIDPGSLPLMPASASSGTVGFNWQWGRYSLQAEGGASRFREEGLDDQRDQALIADAGWQGERLGLRLGHHDLGQYYSSLSGLAGAGLRETYTNASWQATSWMSLAADLRRSENAMASPPVPPPVPSIPPVPIPPGTPFVGRTDAGSLGAQFTFTGTPGLGLGLNLVESRGSSNAGTRNRNTSPSASLSYARQAWNAALGYQNVRLSDSVAGADSRSDTWSVAYGRNWSNATASAPASWTFGTALSGNFQRQRLESGVAATMDTANLQLSGERSGLGRFGASVGAGRGRDVTGRDLRMYWYQLDGGRALGTRGNVRLYVRGTHNFQEDVTIAYRDNTAGMQLNYAF
ncbi:MAG: hypothetical protein IT480_02550 [Gammaproteobacteria bacterium]|nr:hypothetical protein [Gammaproteobacteria bacterium]